MNTILRSMSLRLALGLVALFTVVSLASLAATFVVTQNSFDQAIRADLSQDMAGFRAAPSASALAQLVDAEAAETDPARLVLSYLAPNRTHFGNAFIARDETGYHIVSVTPEQTRIEGRYLALTDEIFGGQLTIARSRAEVEALGDVFLNILVLSLLPTVAVALWGGVVLARRSARHVSAISGTLDQLTGGKLDQRVTPGPGWSADLVQIAERLNVMAEAQERSVAAIRQVSSDIAHDLKTPIQRVSVHLDEIARSQLDEPVRAELDKAQDELDHIVATFHALLQIAQIESGSPRQRFGQVDLRAVCETFCDIYEPSAAEAGQDLTLDADAGPHQVEGDRHLLGQLLANLIENALRHTPAGSRIRIVLRREPEKVLMQVTDDGPGVPESEMALVLRPLYRLDRSRTTPGNGLGLNMVQVIADLHRAQLTLTDARPGLCVTLRLPATEHVVDQKV